MRTTKLFKIFTITAILLVVVLTCFKLASAAKEPVITSKQHSISLAEEQSFKGTSEFYFKPAGDERLWHVLNLYSSKPLDDSDCYNNSIYTFSQDYVEVINNYLVIPDNGKLSFDVIGLNLASDVNNFSNN